MLFSVTIFHQVERNGRVSRLYYRKIDEISCVVIVFKEEKNVCNDGLQRSLAQKISIGLNSVILYYFFK